MAGEITIQRLMADYLKVGKRLIKRDIVLDGKHLSMVLYRVGKKVRIEVSNGTSSP